MIEETNRERRGERLSKVAKRKERTVARGAQATLPFPSAAARQGRNKSGARNSSLTFYEFFAGGGMARLGLGQRWSCLFANDFDPKKAATYQANFGVGAFALGDVAAIVTSTVPSHADLAWASFPCQDLSLAGAGAGLSGERSGTFWAFWRHILELKKAARAPRLVVIENVVGLLTSHQGRDFEALCEAFDSGGYRVGALVIDAVRFVPQSRPRLFFVCVRRDLAIDDALVGANQDGSIHPPALTKAYAKLSARLKSNWLWWRLNLPARARSVSLVDVLEDEPTGVVWHAPNEVKRLLSLMSPANAAKVREAKRKRCKTVGGIYKRTRVENGRKVQRAEVRFDGVAGCLRTPGGGSSRQTILVVQGESVRARLLSPRETARLMGLPENYKLPARYNEAYHLTGDGVVVPVVRHLAAELLEPLLAFARKSVRRAA